MTVCSLHQHTDEFLQSRRVASPKQNNQAIDIDKTLPSTYTSTDETSVLYMMLLHRNEDSSQPARNFKLAKPLRKPGITFKECMTITLAPSPCSKEGGK